MRATWLVGAPVILLCALWAWWPLHNADDVQLDQARLSAELSSRVAALGDGDSPADESEPMPQADDWSDEVFASVRLWNPPPLPKRPTDVESKKAATAPQPPDLELLGIVNENGTVKAALYNRGTDRIVIVANGDHVDQFEITRIETTSIELSADGRAHRISMKPSIVDLNEGEEPG